jgi:hypothetical protein
MSKSNENQPFSVAISLGSATTDGTVYPALYLPKKSQIVSAYLMNGATVNADNSNYFQVSLKNGSTVVAEMDSRAAHENGVTANVAKALNVVSGQETQEAASSLSVLYNETGTVALTNAQLVVTYYPY